MQEIISYIMVLLIREILP